MTTNPTTLPGAAIVRRTDAPRPPLRFPENYCSLTGPRLVAATPPGPPAPTPAPPEPPTPPHPPSPGPRPSVVLTAADPLGDLTAKLAEADAAFLQRQYSAARTAYMAAENMSEPLNRFDLMLVADLGWAGCELQLGDFAVAEAIYEDTATLPYYPALSQTQAAFVFQQLGTVCLDWGNFLFRNDQVSDALAQYAKVVTVEGTPPTSDLYTIAQLKPPAADATKVIANLKDLVAGATTAATLNVNPLLAALLVGVHQQIVKINNGLDYWGHPQNTVPIWSFDYLQSAAINFTQLAISAERDFINFQDRSDQGSISRQQLSQLAVQAAGEVAAAGAQVRAAGAELTAYSDGAALAAQRATDAQANANEYATTSDLAIQYDALRSQISGGDGGSPQLLNGVADQFMSGQSVTTSDNLNRNSDLYGIYSRNNVAAGAQLTAARYNRQYEVDSLQRTAGELQAAVGEAQAEAASAAAKVDAANAAQAVARLHAEGAQQNLQAFDAQTFTPDVWQRMADTMWRLYRRYFDMALTTSQLMQRAYNYETDQSLKFIKTDYSSDEVKGLLGADALMADIQTFTYDLITGTAGKPQPLRQTISLAQNYPFAFEESFRKTGVLEFETRIADFDYLYPGTYAGRIENVEIDVVGMVPVSGLSGTLTNSGISAYRVPASAWTGDSSGLKHRVQSKETLVLSDYGLRNDTALVTTDQKLMRIFQGAGVASSWRLELPKAVNDIDYGALLDVRLTFYYKARYDPDLHDRVLAELNARPGVHSRQRGIQLRWVYPDAFFIFQDSGQLRLTLQPTDFRFNEIQPMLSAVGIVLVTDGTISGSGLTLSLATPGHTGVGAKTDADGKIDSGTPGNGWPALVGGAATGDYVLAMTAADNPTLLKNGVFDLSPIVNVALVLGYSFTPKS